MELPSSGTTSDDEIIIDQAPSQEVQIIESKKPAFRFRSKRYKIQEVIKPNQVILIQVFKRRKRTKRCRTKYLYFYSW